MSMRFREGFRILAALAAAGLVLAVPLGSASGQYFGRNKVNYETFDFHVLSTEHFDIHFYPTDNPAIMDVGRMAERWYKRLSPTFDQTFKDRKPIILYSNQADFQQTNAISGFLGEGTGGVTEPIKNRVVMPLTGDYAGTDHVLGHELVHVFQFDIAFAADDTIPFRINLLPLWLIEGMAEYLSVGRDDPHTAMWLRDAVLQKDFPTIKQLGDNSKFFPYRYGQALWAYVGGKWGDDKVARIYRASGRRGLDYGLAKVLGVTTDSLSTLWGDAVREAYLPAMAGRAKYNETGRKILAPDIDAGEINLAPVLSPDGSRVAFLSEKDLFSIDVFIADAHTGKMQKKLLSAATNGHFDALRFIDSAGTWSPDGRRFALVVFAKGDNEILVLDTHSGDVKRTYHPKSVGAISNPAWSPDGKWIAFSGSAEGTSDLYLLEVATGALTRLNDDRYADLEPTWSPDGKTLAFVTDRGPQTNFQELTYGPMRLGLMDVESRSIRTFGPFQDAKHINPQFSPDGRSLYFISDREGFSDIYRMDLDTEALYQVTRVATGVSGITALSPAMSVSPATGEVVFSLFEDSKYLVYELSAEQAQGTRLRPEGDGYVAEGPVGNLPAASDTLVVEAGEAAPDTLAAMTGSPAGIPAGTDSTTAPGAAPADTAARAAAEPPAGPLRGGILPPVLDQGEAEVSDYLADPESGLTSADSFSVHRYHPKLTLDYVGGYAGGAIGTNRYDTGVGGEAVAYFSDMLGNHTVGVGLSANGGIKDVGAQAFYANRSHRWTWGGVAGHIPYLDVFSTLNQSGDTLIVREFRDRVFLDRASLFTAYPFSSTQRFEFSGGFTRYSFDEEVLEQRLLPNGVVTEPRTTNPDSPAGINLVQGSVALVGDNSFFGFTSPIQGHRYRLEVEPTFGSLSYRTILADYRRYVLLRPFTIAFRGLHLGRYGSDAEDNRLTPLFIGYASLVRGYSSGSFDPTVECDERFGNDCAQFDRLLGSRVAVVNLELRFPFIGTSQWGLINFPYLPTELSLFLDGGTAWTSTDSPKLRFDTGTTDRVPVFSAGASARVNVLGALVVEAYLAAPFQRPQRSTVFGLQISPGW